MPSSTACLLYYVAQSTGHHGYDAANDCDVCCTQSRSTHQLDGFRIGCSYAVNYKVSCGIHLLCGQCSALSADVLSGQVLGPLYVLQGGANTSQLVTGHAVDPFVQHLESVPAAVLIAEGELYLQEAVDT